MLISCLRGDLPAAIWFSSFMDATGGYPGGVWYSSLPLRDCAASDQGPGDSEVLTGSSLHDGPQ